MKTTRQAKIWKNKIEWFNDASIEEVNVIVYNRHPYDVVTKKVIAIVKNGLALHLAIWHNDEFADWFSITHVESGMIAINKMTKTNENDKFNIFNCDYDQLVTDAHKAWDMYTPELKKRLGLIDNINDHIAGKI